MAHRITGKDPSPRFILFFILYSLQTRIRSSTTLQTQVTLVTNFDVTAELRAELSQFVYVENQLTVVDAQAIATHVKSAFTSIDMTGWLKKYQ